MQGTGGGGRRNAERRSQSPRGTCPGEWHRHIDGLAALICEPIAPSRLLLFTALPVSAVATTYWAIARANPGDGRIRAFVRDLPVAAQAIAGWVLIVWALRSAVAVRRERAAGGQGDAQG